MARLGFEKNGGAAGLLVGARIRRCKIRGVNLY